MRRYKQRLVGRWWAGWWAKNRIIKTKTRKIDWQDSDLVVMFQSDRVPLSWWTWPPICCPPLPFCSSWPEVSTIRHFDRLKFLRWKQTSENLGTNKPIVVMCLANNLKPLTNEYPRLLFISSNWPRVPLFIALHCCGERRDRLIELGRPRDANFIYLSIALMWALVPFVNSAQLNNFLKKKSSTYFETSSHFALKFSIGLNDSKWNLPPRRNWGAVKLTIGLCPSPAQLCDVITPSSGHFGSWIVYNWTLEAEQVTL